MADSILSLPKSYNIDNIKSIFDGKYTDFNRYNNLLTSSYVNNTPDEYFQSIIRHTNNSNEEIYTLGVLYKDENGKEYDSQYTVTGSIKRFELNHINKMCNSNECKTYTSNDYNKVCTCVIINAARRELEEEIGLTLKDNAKPMHIFEEQKDNKLWFTLVFDISDCNAYQYNFMHKAISKNENKFEDIKKFKVQVVIIGTEQQLKKTLQYVKEHRSGKEEDIIGITLCKLKQLKFNK